MTVDKILASCQYTDKRGREWDYDSEFGVWIGYESERDEYGILNIGWIVDEKDVRLLIERDLHRGECPSLIACENHPVPCVTIAGGPYGCFHVNPADTSDETYVAHECTHERAMDAARALAVGE